MTNFNWRTKLKVIKTSVLKNFKGTKKKYKIKRIKTEMKNALYNQFLLKGTIENNQTLN